MHRPGMISIWFFIGILLLIYGILILGAGIYGLYHPPSVVLANLHAGLWWPVILLVLGSFYTVRYRP